MRGRANRSLGRIPAEHIARAACEMRLLLRQLSVLGIATFAGCIDGTVQDDAEAKVRPHTRPLRTPEPNLRSTMLP